MELDGASGLGEEILVKVPIPILFTIPNFITAGSGGAMLNIINRLNREKFAPAVAVMKKGGKLDTQVESMGIPFIEAQFTIPAKPYASLAVRAWTAGRIFRPYRFSLWHSFHYGDDYTEALISRLSGALYWVYTKKNMNWYHRSWYLRSLFASRIVAQNTDMYNAFFYVKILTKKARLIPRGVNTNIFYPYERVHLKYHTELEISPQKTTVGCVAHLVPAKDHQTLIKAVSLIENVHLLLAGSKADKVYFSELKNFTADREIEDRVHFLGKIDKIADFLNEIDIFILPTKGSGRMEGCPVALLEAMSCGKACIATDIPGSRDIIESGISGLLVEPENAEELAAVIRKLAGNPGLRAELGTAARKRIEKNFTIEQEVSGHETLYAELMGLNE